MLKGVRFFIFATALLIFFFPLANLNSVFAQVAGGQVLFSDDFNDGNYNGWNAAGNWTVNNGSLESKAEDVLEYGSGIDVGDSRWDNYTLELDENMVSGLDSGIVVRYDGSQAFIFGFKHQSEIWGASSIRFSKFVNNELFILDNIYTQPLVTNNWYHIKIQVYNDNIKLWVNGNKLIDHTESIYTMYPKNGGIALQSWTGMVGFVDVRFDNVKVTSLNKTPIIFIPGIGGSELQVKSDTHWVDNNGHNGIFTHDYKAGEKIWVNELEAGKPGSDDYFDILKLKIDGITSVADLGLVGGVYSGSYGSTIKFFTDNGYILNKDLFTFPYDWRKDIGLTASLLDKKIEDIKKLTGSSKVDIVAHSMGGLVARNYIADSSKAPNVRKFISLGAPYLGSSKFLKALMYGECLTKKEYKEISKFVCLGVAPTEVKDVLQNSSGAYQLAPSRTYYTFYDGSDVSHLVPFRDDRDIDFNGITGPLNYSQTLNLLTNLAYNSPLYRFNESLHSVMGGGLNANGVQTSIIVGSGQPTIGQIVEGNMFDLGGVKISKTGFLFVNGDETVPLYSASLNDSSKKLSLSGSAKIYYAKMLHEDLAVNNQTLGLVKNILNDINQIPTGISNSPFLLNGTQISINSSVDIDVYDSAGNHTGLTTEDTFEENIPGSTYETLGDTKSIWLPDDGIYKVKFAAADKGNLEYQIRTYKNDKNTKTVLFRDPSLTAATKGEETLDTTSKDPSPLKLDKNGDGVVDSSINSTFNISGSEFDDNSLFRNEIQKNPAMEKADF